VLRDCPHFAR